MYFKLNLFLLLISHNKILIHGLVIEKVKAVGATNSFTSEEVYHSIQPSVRKVTYSRNNNILHSDIKYNSKIVARKKREVVLVDEDFDVLLRSRRQVKKEMDMKLIDYPIFEESSGDGMIIESLSEQPDNLKKMEISSKPLDYTNATATIEEQGNIQNSTDSDLRTDSNSEEVSDDDVITSAIDSTITHNITTSDDDISTHYTDSATTVDLSITDSDYDSETVLNESTLFSCMKSTCASMELEISSSSNGLISEGTNQTFKCFSSNYSDVNLYWYIGNTSVSKLVKSYNQSVLELNIVDAKLSDSGIYTCIKYFEGTCCYKEIHLNVYESPVYKYHLLTIGVVVAACLVSCMLVGIWRHWTMSKYEKKLRDKKVKKSLLT